MTAATLDARFRAVASAHAGRMAVAGPDAAWTYADLDAEAGRVAAHLAEAGVQRGDRVAAALPNAAVYAAMYVGAARAGAALVPLNLALPADDLAFVVGAAEAKVLVAAETFLPALGKILDGLADAPKVIRADRRPWADAGPFEPPHVDPEDIAAIYYTSGTTGRPKGAMLPHRAIVADAEASAEAFGLGAGRRYTVPLPLFHSFAATVGLWLPLLSGGSARFLPPDGGALLEALRAGGAGIVIGVPALFTDVVRRAGGPVRADGLDFFVSGGAALPAPVRAGLVAAFGAPVHEGYGTTECGPVVSAERPGAPAAPGTVGPPLPGVRVEIRDAEGARCGIDEVGEVVVHGPNVFLGYFDHPEATDRAMRGGWFHTGDLGALDAEGRLRIIDRRGDVIRWKGLAIYPHEIEEVLATHPAVREAAVVGVPDADGAEVPAAFVVPAADPPPPTDDLIEHCRVRLAVYKVPRSIEYRTTLPRTATGKVLKRALRQKWM